MKLLPLEQIERATGAEFQEFARRLTPVVLKGLAQEWPAVRLWSWSYLRQHFGHLPTLVRGSDKAIDVFFNNKVPYLQMTFGEYLDVILDPQPDRSRPYFGNFELNKENPTIGPMLAHLSFPDFFPGSAHRLTRIWIGAAGQQSTIHNDNYDNLNAQILGAKRFLLFSPREYAKLYAERINENLWASPVDPTAPDLDRFSAFADIQGFECALEPGDLLYIPSFWWHHAQAMTPCVNVNAWHSPADNRKRYWHEYVTSDL